MFNAMNKVLLMLNNWTGAWTTSSFASCELDERLDDIVNVFLFHFIPFIPILPCSLCCNTLCCYLWMKEELCPLRQKELTSMGDPETTRVWVKADYFTNSSRKGTGGQPKSRQWRRVKQTDNLCPTTWRLSRTWLFPHKWLIKLEKQFLSWPEAAGARGGKPGTWKDV